jgi:hypothetical protein
MTSTVTDVAVAPAPAQPERSGGVDADIVREIAEQAAREITGVDRDVEVRVKLAAGVATLRMRLPIRYPMPIWQVADVCRTHVRERLRDRAGVPMRRLDIDVSVLPGRAR